MTGTETIFVQIAAYRDPELVPTVIDCIARAKNPNALRVAICWQHAENESIAPIATLPQVRFIAIPHLESKGACWARTLACQLYENQDYYLQIDSHHRFVDGWDEKLIAMLKGLEADGVKKPLLTAYPPSYDPKNDPAGRAEGGIQIDFNAFNDNSVFSTGSSPIKNWQTRTKPIRGRFFAGGFAFARGAFITDVPYDPSLYFQGEEMAMALRAFTHGYDIYHPHDPVLWHHYMRHETPKHWTDHVKKADTPADTVTWDKLNQYSQKRIKQLFSYAGYRYEDIEWGKFGRGTERSLRDYELFCGIDFRHKRITRDCLNKTEPPSTWNRQITDEDWEKSLLKMYEHTIELMPAVLPLDDYDFLYLGYERADGSSIYCTNLKGDVIKTVTDRSKTANIVIPITTRFFADEMPVKWVFWPHSTSQGWMGRIGGMMPKVVY